MQHLLTSCIFACQVWHAVFTNIGLQDHTPRPQDNIFVDWCQQATTGVSNSVRKGMNSLIMLVAWAIRKHRNDCVFQAGRPDVAVMLHFARDEAKLWCLAGAKGLAQFLENT